MMQTHKQPATPAIRDLTAQHVSRVMSMSDPEDIRLTRGIVDEQANVLDVARRLNRGEIVGNLNQLPTLSTFTGREGEEVRYLVIVKVYDPITGQKHEFPVEIFSDVPILPDDVKAMAVERANTRVVPLSPPTSISPDAPVRVTGVVIVSAGKRA